MRRWLQSLEAWYLKLRKEQRRARYFEQLRLKGVAFGAGFQSPLEREDDRQRRVIAMERTRWVP